jgi:ADP-ribosylglycohydrolase
MRVAPIGLYAAALGLPSARAFVLGCEVAALTHGHPSGQLPAGVLAMVICQLAQGGELRAGLQDAKALLGRQPGHEETLAAILAAESLAASAAPAPEALLELGQGWVAEETLGIALYCALRGGNLEEGVIMAANITGDSDSTAAITGNLLGAALGVHEIPDRWLEKLELKQAIIEMADDLATLDQWQIQPLNYDPPPASGEHGYWLSRYPGW